MPFDKTITDKIPEQGSESKLDFLFPQVISNTQKDRNTTLEWAEEISNWATKKFEERKNNGTMIYTPLHSEEMLKPVCKFVDDCVSHYTKELKFPDEYECTESWAHDYTINSYQQWHAHAGNVISAVYIVWARPWTDSHLWFKNPIEDYSNPYNVTPNTSERELAKVYHHTQYPQYGYPSMPGCCYVFRSSMFHSTQLKHNTDRRLVLAFNYNKKGLK
tara:strand:- start:22 stop:675 length:654 start_codon:yes stop_codon:yes gene_type:complete